MKVTFSGLWQHPDFLKLWFGQTISEFGSRITRDGLSLVGVLALAATPAQIGLLAAVSSIPVILFSLIVGVWVDRLPRRPLMIMADIARMGLLLSIPIAAVTGHLTLGLLFIVAPMLSLLTLVFNVAYRAMLPSLVLRHHLLEGNTKLAITSSLAEVGGPSIAGLLIQVLSAPIAIAFDAISFACSAVSLLLIHAPEPPPIPSEETHFLGQMREGFGVIAHQPILLTMVIAMAVSRFFGNFFAALYSFYVIRELGLSVALLGIIVSAGGVGALLGTFFAGRLTQRFGLGRTLIGTQFFGALTNLLIPLAGGPPLLAVSMLIFTQIAADAMMAIYEVNEMTLRQTLVPGHLLGRANASAGFLVEGIAPLGALVGGILGSIIGARLGLLVAVLGIFAVAVWLLTTSLRQVEYQAAVT